MIELSLLTLLAQTPNQETIHRFCAEQVGIPYASDNFTDEEYQLFLSCVQSFKQS